VPGIVQEIGEKIKRSLADQNLFTAIVLVMVALTAFGLGRGSVRGEEPAALVENAPPMVTPTAPSESLPATFYVASKNGEVYHLPHCSGAKRINEANKITFKTKDEAEAAGYRPAANCKGI
jgi:hypothetical protein